MPNYTKTINLEKPLQTEVYDVDKRNANWDKIDKAIKKDRDDADTHAADPNAHANGISGNAASATKDSENNIIAKTYRKKTISDSITNADFNLLTEAGVYQIDAGELKNAPASVYRWGALIVETAGFCITQTYVTHHPEVNGIFVRFWRENSWGNWGRLAYSSNIPTKISSFENDLNYYKSGVLFPFSYNNEINFDHDVENVVFGHRGHKVSGAYVFRNGNGQLAPTMASTHFDAQNNVSEHIVSKNLDHNGYIKYASGLLVQWGANEHGWVTFPIAFNSFRKIITNHQGAAYFNSRAIEYNSLTGFTLSVHNNSGTGQDAQWIAIGV